MACAQATQSRDSGRAGGQRRCRRTWSIFVVGGVALSVGMFLALALVGAARKSIDASHKSPANSKRERVRVEPSPFVRRELLSV